MLKITLLATFLVLASLEAVAAPHPHACRELDRVHGQGNGCACARRDGRHNAQLGRHMPAMHPAAPHDPIVRAERLALHFDQGRTRALDGIDIAVGEGEFVAIVGPSGCGKSSLLNLIGALDRPTAGERLLPVRSPIRRCAISRLFRRSHVGFVFQSFHLIPTLSAIENVVVPTIGGPGGGATSSPTCVRSHRAARPRPPARSFSGRAFRRRAPAGRHRAGADQRSRAPRSPTSRPAASTAPARRRCST